MSAVAGLSAAGTLLDEDEDTEEKRRRMEAKIAAENFGAAIGFAAGAAMAVKENWTSSLREKNRKSNSMSKRWEDCKNGKHQAIGRAAI